MTRVLLDTHVVLWLLTDDPRLGPKTRTAIQEAHEVLVSAASLWEIEIKRSLGKLQAPRDLAQTLGQAGLRELAITWRHAAGTEKFELPHRDPFDRMLCAQAQAEAAIFITADPEFLKSARVELLDARG